MPVKKRVDYMRSVAPFISMRFLVNWNTGLFAYGSAAVKTSINLFFCKIFSSRLCADVQRCHEAVTHAAKFS
ncbi:MAG: hypothetical protein E6H10_11690 [Bacteroidetes bacterium]|nr:MAG: hypothetical protein E6H10_11690 [Bacteroidota bacterium]